MRFNKRLTKKVRKERNLITKEVTRNQKDSTTEAKELLKAKQTQICKGTTQNRTNSKLKTQLKAK